MNTSEPLAPWLEFWTFPSTVVNVLIGCVILAAVAGLIGCFAYLRKQSLIGDALAHAALPGVCVAFMLTGTKDPLIILIGATVSCWLGALSVEGIVRYTRCKQDSALGIVLSVFFGVGYLLLSSIQNSGAAAQSGLDHFIFGQAAAMVRKDVYVIAAVGLGIVLCVVLAFKELKVICFDPDFAQASGLPRRVIEIALATLIVLAVAIGLQAVGVVLMAALLVTPAAAARFWTHNLAIMGLLAAAFGAVSGFAGAYASYLSTKMPTGPWIVVAVTSIFGISLLFAPEQGMVARFRRTLRFRRRTARENLLRTLYLLGENTNDFGTAYAPAELQGFRSMQPARLAKTLRALERRGLAEERETGKYALTADGLEEAKRVTRLHRLWELYLTNKLDIAADHVHDDAEEIEHILTPELEARLLDILEQPDEDPHRATIPAPTGGAT